MELKARKDMDPRFTWDFTAMFASDEAWEAEIAALNTETDGIDRIKGTLGSSAKALKSGILAVQAIAERLERAYIYAMLHKSADGGEPKYQAMDGKAMNIYVKFSMACAFIEPEILAIPEEKLNTYMASSDMDVIRFYVSHICRMRAHTKDESTERLLAQMGDLAQTPQDAYEMLTNVDLELPLIKDEDGKEQRLTQGNFGVFRESRDRAVREAAFTAMFGSYKKFNNTFAATYSGSIKQDVFMSRVRGFENSRAAALYSHNVPASVYDSLIAAVRENQPAVRDYIELRKKALGLDKIDMYDLYTPMVKDVEYPVTFEEAKVLVKEALKPLGEDYQKLLDRAYAEHWMDVYENKGKRSGAFSCGVYGVHPYVLLNYTDTLDDAFTMAHELGHAMHSYLSDTTQEYINHDYAIMAAEVASITNEMLLLRYLLKTETQKDKRAYILNHFLESVRTTMVRQTLFAEFEFKAHELYEKDEPLTAEALNKLYFELECAYYDGAEIPELMSYEWSYIPHFYTAYYVYQYATGLASAVAISSRIIDEGRVDGYLKFLTLGGSDYPIDELKVAGVDLTQPTAVASAMQRFEETIKELSALLDN